MPKDEILKIDYSFINQEFWIKPLLEKKKVINKVLIDYAIAMMRGLGIPFDPIENNGDYYQLLDIIDIVNYHLNGKNRNFFYAEYINLIWYIVAELQKHGIESKCEKSICGSPSIAQNDLGWQIIIINKHSDPSVLARKMIEEFNKYFNIDKIVDQVLVKKL
jgi:hypothetical protein